MTKYKTARDEAAEAHENESALDYSGDAISFRAGADFATKYWLQESEEIKELIKALNKMNAQVDALDTYTGLVAEFTKLIEEMK
jgi:hypothetical protein